jgi:hypothetical protein
MKKRLKKWLIILIPVLIFCWFFSGSPLDRTAEWLTYKVAGETVSIKGFNLFPYPSIRELIISAPDGKGESPIALRRLKIVPNYWPSKGRYIHSLSASDVYVKINRDTDSGFNNWDWYEKYMEPGEEESSDAWIPEEVQLEKINVSVMEPTLAGILLLDEVIVRVPSSDHAVVTFSNEREKQDGIFSALGKDDGIFRLDEGVFTGLIEGNVLENNWTFTTNIQSPDHVKLNLTGQFINDHLTVACEEAIVHPGILNQWPFSAFHDSAKCKSLSINSFEAGMTLDAPETMSTSFAILAEHVEVGGSDGDVQMDAIEMVGHWDGELQKGNLSLRTDNEVTLIAEAIRNPDETIRIMMDTHSWDKEQVLPLLPGGARSAFKSLPVESIESAFSVVVGESDFDMEAHIDSFQSGQDVDVIQIALNISGANDGSRPIVGHADLHWGDNVIQGQSYVDENGEYRFKTLYEQVNPEIWLSLIGISVPDGIQARINGTIDGYAGTLTDPISMALNLEFNEITLFDEPVSSVTLKGNSIVDQASYRTTTESMTLTSEDEFFTAELNEFSWDGNEETMAGNVVAAMDLQFISNPLGLTDWVGEMNGAMSFQMNDGKIEAPMKLTSNYLGFQDWLLPYEAEFVINAEMNLDMDTSLAELRYGSIQVGEGSSARIDAFTYDLDQGSGQGAMVLESDMRLAKEMGFLKEISGALNSQLNWSIEDENLKLNWDAKGRLSQAVLLEDAGTLSDGEFSLKGASDGETLMGNGQLSAKSITASGATVHNAHGAIELSETALTFSKLDGGLFKGIVTGDATIDLTNDTYPIWFEGKIQNIDLAQMTTEVQPPKTNLTGLADGTLSAEYSTNGLQGFTLQVDSKENFSMNRSLVEEIMQTQKLLTGLGQKKAEKTLDKFLGSEPERPFDSAEMYIYLVGEKIEGLVDLLSVKTRDYNGLNLHINMDIDKPALISSLKMLEESNIENMEF